MSADDGIRLKELQDSSGRNFWVADHYFISAHFQKPDKEYLSHPERYPRYPNLDAVSQAYRDAASNTEYGFDICWLPDTPDVVKIQSFPETIEDPERLAEIAGIPFLEELTALIEKYSRGSESGTPDDVLARFLNRQLMIFSETIRERAVTREGLLKTLTIEDARLAGYLIS